MGEARVLDATSKEGAQIIASRIVAYWQRKGYDIKIGLVRLEDHNEEPVWTIKSNIGKDGFPPRADKRVPSNTGGDYRRAVPISTRPPAV